MTIPTFDGNDHQRVAYLVAYHLSEAAYLFDWLCDLELPDSVKNRHEVTEEQREMAYQKATAMVRPEIASEIKDREYELAGLNDLLGETTKLAIEKIKAEDELRSDQK